MSQAENWSDPTSTNAKDWSDTDAINAKDYTPQNFHSGYLLKQDGSTFISLQSGNNLELQ